MKTFATFGWFLILALFALAGLTATAGMLDSWKPVPTSRLEALRLGTTPPPQNNGRCCRAPILVDCCRPCVGTPNCINGEVLLGTCNRTGMMCAAKDHAVCEEMPNEHCTRPNRIRDVKVQKCTLTGMNEACAGGGKRCIAVVVEAPDSTETVVMVLCNAGESICLNAPGLCN